MNERMNRLLDWINAWSMTNELMTWESEGERERERERVWHTLSHSLKHTPHTPLASVLVQISEVQVRSLSK